MRVCKCCISDKSIHSSLLSWRDRNLKNSRIKAKILKIEGPGKKKSCTYETYKNTVMPHERHIYAKSSDMAKATMRSHPESDHTLPHRKCVM